LLTEKRAGLRATLAEFFRLAWIDTILVNRELACTIEWIFYALRGADETVDTEVN